MKLIKMLPVKFWLKYIKFSDRYFHLMSRFNDKLINLDKYKNDDIELAMMIKFSGQV